MRANRRTFLKVLGGAGLAFATAPVFQAFAEPLSGSDEFFIFIHAAGGWDVMLWADPRNERKGIIEPPTDDNVDTALVRRWVNQPLDASTNSFKIVQPTGSKIPFGPAIGNLGDLYDRLCVVNGLAMNTVSHADGTVFSATGRHLAGGQVPASSIDTIVANEFGKEQLFPSVSARFPSSFVPAPNLDRRAMPLVVDTVGAVSKVLTRVDLTTTQADRDAVTTMLTNEARDLAAISEYPGRFSSMEIQFQALSRMFQGNIRDVFDATKLKLAQPAFNYAGRFHGSNVINAAFAVEAMRLNLVRCLSFSFVGFDTHFANYANQAAIQQEMFDAIATLVKTLDQTPHPTRPGAKLSEHTHILVVSEFCRTPQINLTSGRDHYPNNAALVISPLFKRNFVYGKADAEQLLPVSESGFTDGPRPMGPADLLATFLGALKIDPQRYMRDGEVVKALLAT